MSRHLFCWLNLALTELADHSSEASRLIVRIRYCREVVSLNMRARHRQASLKPLCSGQSKTGLSFSLRAPGNEGCIHSEDLVYSYHIGVNMLESPTTLSLHSSQIVTFCLFYSTTFWILSPIISARCFPKYTTFSREGRIKWDTRVVSQVQAIFICACAFHVILADESRKQTSPQWRLMDYSSMAGRVQAFAAGYFLWDLMISSLYLEVHGFGSLLHAICALCVTMIGFVSCYYNSSFNVTNHT